MGMASVQPVELALALMPWCIEPVRRGRRGECHVANWNVRA